MRILRPLTAAYQRIGSLAVLSLCAASLLLASSRQAQAQTVPQSEFRFTSSSYETSESSGALTITVTRTNSFLGKLLVDAIVQDGTGKSAATNGIQYKVNATNTLVFNDFQTSASFDINILDDSKTNGNRNFGVILANPRPAPGEDLGLQPVITTSSKKSAAVSILDNDDLMSFNLEKTYYKVEEGKSIKINVQLAQPPGDMTSGVTVDWKVSTDPGDITLHAGSDFAGGQDIDPPLSGTLTFGPNDVQQTIELSIPTDSTVEFNEDFAVILSNAQGVLTIPGTNTTTTGTSTGATTATTTGGTTGATTGGTTGATDGTTTGATDGGTTGGTSPDQMVPFKLGKVSKAIVTILFNGDPTFPQPAGSVDQNFLSEVVPNTTPPLTRVPGANNSVYAIASESDGSTIAVGNFTAINAFTAYRIARLDTNGLVDLKFKSGKGADDYISAVAIYNTSDANNGKILIGGGFASFNGQERKGLARLNKDGSLDETFNPGTGADGPVYAISIQANGGVYIGGDFSSYGGLPRNRVARVLDDGSPDATFDPGAGAVGGPVFALAAEVPSFVHLFATNQANGAPEVRTDVQTGATAGFIDLLYVFGTSPSSIHVYQGKKLVLDTGMTNSEVIVTNTDGTTLTNFVAKNLIVPYGGGTGTVLTFVVNEGNTNQGPVWALDAIISPSIGLGVIIGGDFTSVNNFEQNRVARLDVSGAVDQNFRAGTGADGGSVYALKLQDDGKILVGGAFTTFNSQDTRGIVRLLPDGTPDKTFITGAGPNDAVSAIAVDDTGKILIGGYFTGYNQTRRVFLARLLDDGSLDTEFLDTAYNHNSGFPNPDGFAPNGNLNTIALDQSGNVLVGGAFSLVGGGPTRVATKPRNNIAKLVGGGTPGPGNLQFSDLTFGVDENGGALAATVTRSNGNLGPAGVTSKTSDGVAVAGADYTAGTFNVLFKTLTTRSDGDTTATYFSVPIIDDLEIEGDENFNLDLFSPFGALDLGGEVVPSGVALGGVPKARGIVVDNDVVSGVLSFSAASYDANEGDGSITINVQRTGGLGGNLSVRFAATGGTTAGLATENVDFTPVNGTLTFLGGQTNKSFVVKIKDDALVENDEIVNLRLFSPSPGATLGANANSVINIVDNDYAPGRLSFGAGVYMTGENTNAVVIVRRSGGNVGVVSVDYSTADISAKAPGDYLPVQGTLTWNDGDSAPKQIIIPIVQDGIVESLEQFKLSLSNASPDGALGTRTTAVVNILDDDFYGKLSFNAPVYLGDENGTNVAIKVIRREGSAETVSVHYATSKGTAIPGADYTDVSGDLEFGPGETSKTFLIPILDDLIRDGDKTVRMALSSPVNATLGNVTNAVLTIIDNESVNIPAGSVETDFGKAGGPENSVYSIGYQTDGKIVIGGDFNLVDRQVRNHLARLNTDGRLDVDFADGLGVNGSVRALAIQATNSSILIAGTFTQISGLPYRYLARIGAGGEIDNNFNPGAGADLPIYAVAETFVNGVRKVLIGGGFSTFNSFSRHGVARLNENGSVDQSFNPGSGVVGTVYYVAVQRDGKILIAGEFGSVNGVARNHLARLNQDGTLDESFDAGLPATGSVRGIGIQSDDRIVIGGLFDSVGLVSRNSLARLNPDGTLDTSFDPGDGADGAVYSVAVQLDGKILVAGDFNKINGVLRGKIARLNEDGSIDPSINFGFGANGFINTVVVQPDRKLLIGGGFTQFDGTAQNHIARIYGGSLTGSGGIEFAFPSWTVSENLTNAIISMRRIGGLAGSVSVDFSTKAGTATAGLDYTDIASTLTFAPGETIKFVSLPLIDDNLPEPNETVNLLLSTNLTAGSALGNQPISTLVIVSDDSLVGFRDGSYSANESVAGGRATVYVTRQGVDSNTVTVNYSTEAGTATPGLDYANVSGTITFNPGESIRAFTIPIVDDAIVEGNETIILHLDTPTGGAILDRATSVLTIFDNDFAPGVLSFGPAPSVNENAGLATVTINRSSGKTGVVSVDYATKDGSATAGSDYNPVQGTISFLDGEISKTITVPILDDTKVEGNETIILTLSNAKGGAALGSPNTVAITIVDDDFGPGSLDQSFDPGAGANGNVLSLVIQPDSKVLISGAFQSFDGLFRGGVARLNAGGSLDLGFASGRGADGVVNSLGLRSNGTVVVGGAFGTLGNVTRGKVGRLNPNGVVDTTFAISADENGNVNDLAVQPNGQVLIGGTFTIPTGYIARLNADGSLDVSFASDGGTDGPVNSVALQEDGSVIIGGNFTKVGPVSRGSLARLLPNGLLDRNFAVGGGANGQVRDILVLPSGQIVIVGDFTAVSGVGRKGIARLNSDGTVDRTFDPGSGSNGQLYSVMAQSSGKLFAGGQFSNFGGQDRSNIVRLNLDGSVDLGFDAGRGPNGAVRAIAPQSDGKVLIGGDFTTVNGFLRNHVARLNGDTVDPEVPIVFSSVTRLGEGLVRLVFSTANGRKYQVESSEDLKSWTARGQVTATGASSEFVDSSAIGVEHRFYRVKSVP